jgi:hypothetical protein
MAVTTTLASVMRSIGGSRLGLNMRLGSGSGLMTAMRMDTVTTIAIGGTMTITGIGIATTGRFV